MTYLKSLTREGREKRCDIPVKTQTPGTDTITEREKEKLRALVVDGEIPFDVYIKAINEILNPK